MPSRFHQLLLPLCILLLLCVSVYHVQGAPNELIEPIYSCQSIIVSGTYYLVANITVGNIPICFDIQADDVTLQSSADLTQRYTIHMPQASPFNNTIGISVSSSSRVQILGITLSGFAVGVMFDDVQSSSIRDVYVDGKDNFLIRSSLVAGIMLVDCVGVTILGAKLHNLHMHTMLTTAEEITPELTIAGLVCIGSLSTRMTQSEIYDIQAPSGLTTVTRDGGVAGGICMTSCSHGHIVNNTIHSIQGGEPEPGSGSDSSLPGQGVGIYIGSESHFNLITENIMRDISSGSMTPSVGLAIHGQSYDNYMVAKDYPLNTLDGVAVHFYYAAHNHINATEIIIKDLTYPYSTTIPIMLIDPQTTYLDTSSFCINVAVLDTLTPVRIESVSMLGGPALNGRGEPAPSGTGCHRAPIFLHNLFRVSMVSVAISNMTAGNGSPRDDRVLADGGFAFGVYMGNVSNANMLNVVVRHVVGGKGATPMISTVEAASGGAAIGVFGVDSEIFASQSIVSDLKGGVGGNGYGDGHLSGEGGAAFSFGMLRSTLTVEGVTAERQVEGQAGAGDPPEEGTEQRSGRYAYDDLSHLNVVYGPLIIAGVQRGVVSYVDIPTVVAGDIIVFTRDLECNNGSRYNVTTDGEVAAMFDESGDYNICWAAHYEAHLMLQLYSLTVYMMVPPSLASTSSSSSSSSSSSLLASTTTSTSSSTDNATSSSSSSSSDSTSTSTTSSSSISSSFDLASTSISTTSSSSSSSTTLSSSTYSSSYSSSVSTTGPPSVPAVVVAPSDRVLPSPAPALVLVYSTDNRVLAYIDVPGGLFGYSTNYTLTLRPGDPSAPLPTTIVSPVIDIAVEGALGDKSRKFASPVSITFSEAHLSPFTLSNINQLCLAYLSEDDDGSTWICEDHHLRRVGSGIVGKTSHFTPFALLISPSRDDNGSPQPVSGLSSENVAITTVFVIVGVVGITSFVIVYIRRRRRGRVSRRSTPLATAFSVEMPPSGAATTTTTSTP